MHGPILGSGEGKDAARSMILASMDRCTSLYRICDVNGDLYASAQTKLHRPDADEGCFAACDHRIQLNDDYHDYGLSQIDRASVCLRCVPMRMRNVYPEPIDPVWSGLRIAGDHAVLIRRAAV
ncbi:MAG: hypothetical protein WBB41_01345 [Candidatus Nanopelagicales bacterium]